MHFSIILHSSFIFDQYFLRRLFFAQSFVILVKTIFLSFVSIMSFDFCDCHCPWWTEYAWAFFPLNYLCCMYLHSWFPSCFPFADLNQRKWKHTLSYTNQPYTIQCIIVTFSLRLFGHFVRYLWFIRKFIYFTDRKVRLTVTCDTRQYKYSGQLAKLIFSSPFLLKLYLSWKIK